MRKRNHSGIESGWSRHCWLAMACLAALALLAACNRDPAVRKQKYMNSGNKYFSQKRYDEAVIEYRNALQVDPQFAEAYYRLGLSFLQLGQWVPAGQSFSRAVAIDPENADAHLRLGNILLGVGQYADARAQGDEVLQRNPQNADAHILLGQILVQQKNFPDAKKEFELALKIVPESPVAYTDLGLAELMNREFDDAEANFQKALQLQPEEAQFAINLANFYRSRQKPERALEVLHESIARNPKAIVLQMAVADLFYYENRREEMRNLLTQLEVNDHDYPDARRNVADFYFSHKDVPAALDRYLALAGKDERNPALVKRVVECYLQLSRWQEAEEWTAKQDKKKKDPEIQLLHARALAGEYRLREAIAEDQMVIKAAPGLVAAQHALAQAYLEKGDLPAAKEAMIDALRLQPGYLPAFLGLGNIALRQGDSQVALQYATQIISQTYWVGEGHLLAGNAHFLRGDLPSALNEFEIASSLEPDDATPLERRGQVLTAQHKYDLAESAFEAALAVAPGSAEALGGLVNNFLQRGQAERARARIDRQIESQPSNYRLQLVKGEFCADRSEWSCAEQSFRRAIEINPYSLYGYSQLAHIYKARDRWPEAIQQYEKARQQFPDVLPNYITLGIAYEAQGNYDRAIQLYQDALKIDPTFVPAENNLAWLYLQHDGPLSEALRLAQLAKNQQPDDPHINDTLAWGYYKRGWYPSAAEILESIVAKNPKSSTYQFHLGMTYMAEGKPELGRKLLENALRAGLTGNDAEAAKNALAAAL